MPKYTEAGLNAALAILTGWTVENGELIKVFELGSYADHLAFVNAVGRIADRLDHHPDIVLTYPSVQFALSTHSEGGITKKDTDLAAKIDQVALLFG